jgi:hypothetical protein
MDLQAWLAAFLLTVLIEGALFLTVLGPTRRNGLAVLAANVCTHPLGSWLIAVEGLPFAPVEAGILVVEGLLYRFGFRLRWGDAFGAAALCNGVTMAVSLLW